MLLHIYIVKLLYVYKIYNFELIKMTAATRGYLTSDYEVHI
jgi:hypothetical protein